MESGKPKVIISRDVRFNETQMYSHLKNQLRAQDSNRQESVEVEVEQSEVLGENIDLQERAADGDLEPEPAAADNYRLARDRPRREIKPPARYGHADMISYALLTAESYDEEEPQSLKEAINSKDADKWKIAMADEMRSLQKNQTWELVPRPKNQKVVACKWIYKRKEGILGVEEARYKARLVAKGFTQREGVDYHEVFSPVVKHTSIRVLLALTAVFDMELEQMDVKTAFLHGELEETIYMAQPEGFKKAGMENHVCLLEKSLYGLKQSPRQWYKRFDLFMLRNGFSRSSFDGCVYFRMFKEQKYMYLLLYVDDMLLACQDEEEINRVKKMLRTEFEMKDLGPARKILGIEIFRDRTKGSLFLSQKGYLEKVLERFRMQDSKPVITPMAQHFKLSVKDAPSTEQEVNYMERVPYSSVVGSLMYLMVCTRPDLAHAVSLVSRYLSNAGKNHWVAAKWILRYLRGTTKEGLLYGTVQDDQTCVVGFVDSDYAGDLDNRRSLTGYVFQVFGCTVSWKASLQHVVALSTTEAEYIAITEAVKEAMWLMGLIRELGVQQKSVTVYCDSQSAIHLTKNQMFHERTKHIDI